MSLENQSSHFLHFILGGNAFVVPLSEVREILPMPSLSRPPQLSPMIEGFLSLGGVAIPVLRLDRMLGMPEAKVDASCHLILVKTSADPYALLVDRVNEVLAIGLAELMPLSANHTFGGGINAQVRRGAEVSHVLSVERVLSQRGLSRAADGINFSAQQTAELAKRPA